MELLLPGYCDAFGVWVLRWDRFFQFFECTGFFQFFHQTFDCFLWPFSLDRRLIVSFFPRQQTFHDWRCKRQHFEWITFCIFFLKYFFLFSKVFFELISCLIWNLQLLFRCFCNHALNKYTIFFSSNYAIEYEIRCICLACSRWSPFFVVHFQW